MRFRIKIENNLSDQFQTSVGLRQGDALSCILFNLALGKVIRESQIETKGTVLTKVPRYLLTQMISTDALKETIKKLVKVARIVRLTINLQKTYYMEVTKKTTNTKKLNLYDQDYERVKEFNCLGTILTEHNNIATEIKERIIMDNKTSYALKKQIY